LLPAITAHCSCTLLQAASLLCGSKNTGKLAPLYYTFLFRGHYEYL
jgi:hypothetical protein